MSIPPQPPSSPEPYPQPGPYGQPGQPGPYGAQQGWYAPPPMSQKTNTLAIVAFVMSVVCGIPLVPLILGIIALSQIRDRGEKGKGFAIAAIVIHSLAIAFYAIVLVLGLSGGLGDSAPPKRDTSGQATTPGSVRVEDIRKGDCFNTGGKLAEYDDEEGGDAGFRVKIVPCGEAHEGEAYSVFNLDGGAYPGKDKVISIAEEKCGGAALTGYVGADAKLSETLEVYYYYPQPTTWIRGDREITCFIGDTSGSSTGSLRAAGS